MTCGMHQKLDGRWGCLQCDTSSDVRKPCAAAREAHKIMTLQEYVKRPIVGWHEVCHDVGGCGNVGIRFLA